MAEYQLSDQPAYKTGVNIAEYQLISLDIKQGLIWQNII